MIILWTYNPKQQKWVEECNQFSAIARIMDDNWKILILITSSEPLNDYESVISILKIIRKSKKELPVIIGIAKPTAEFQQDYLAHGASEVWAVNINKQNFTRKWHFSDELIILKNVCPDLHVKRGDPIELSVCGKRNNRLILVMHHFQKWCIAEYTTCPYWSGITDDC